MRSLAEIVFRMRQEISNALEWVSPPQLVRLPPEPVLPGAAAIDRLRSTEFAVEIQRLADEIVRHRFPVFGAVIDTGPEIRWRRDYIHGIETGTPYFRRIPYLDFARAGDHKYIWELNRHQHLVILAQAFRFTGRSVYLDEIQSQLKDWVAANPYMRGINWTSALEVAFRAFSWIWVDHLAGASLPTGFRHSWITELYRHGRYLEHNLSIYFSPNTHLLGEAVVLHTLGALYPDLPPAARWRRLGRDLVEQQMERQVRADGSHFEQSTYYHVYALDLFTWQALHADASPAYRDKLLRMAQYLDALLGPSGRLPLMGDDDGGRLFHPYGDRDSFGRDTLATCGVYFGRPQWIRSEEDLAPQAAWWIDVSNPRPAASSLPPLKSHLFPDSGMAVMTAGDVQIVIKAGGFGPSTAGHSHSDALSFVCHKGAGDFLMDSGTYTYLADPAWRNRFRGSAAHNTVRIDGKDQAVPAGPFRWDTRPAVRIGHWESTGERDWLAAECAYGGFVHRRQFLFVKPEFLLLVVDTISGPTGDHLLEQFWHPGTKLADLRFLAFSQPVEALSDWRSRVYGAKEPATVLRASYRGLLPVRLAAAVSFEQPVAALTLDVTSLHLRFESGRLFSVLLSK